MLDGEVARGSDYPVGASVSFNSVLHMVRRVAQTQATVLFLGERGVGKEAFARMLHRLSARSAKAFVGLNCTAIPESLMESELFGTERDAFTDLADSVPQPVRHRRVAVQGRGLAVPPIVEEPDPGEPAARDCPLSVRRTWSSA